MVLPTSTQETSGIQFESPQKKLLTLNILYIGVSLSGIWRRTPAANRWVQNCIANTFRLWALLGGFSRSSSINSDRYQFTSICPVRGKQTSNERHSLCFMPVPRKAGCMPQRISRTMRSISFPLYSESARFSEQVSIATARFRVQRGAVYRENWVKFSESQMGHSSRILI